MRNSTLRNYFRHIIGMKFCSNTLLERYTCTRVFAHLFEILFYKKGVQDKEQHGVREINCVIPTFRTISYGYVRFGVEKKSRAL